MIFRFCNYNIHDKNTTCDMCEYGNKIIVIADRIICKSEYEIYYAYITLCCIYLSSIKISFWFIEELILYYAYYLNDVPTSNILHRNIYVRIIYNIISCTKYEIWNDIKDKKKFNFSFSRFYLCHCVDYLL